MTQTIFRTCNLCEAACGLALEVEGDQILSVRPDEDDVFSRGHICPKGVASAAIHHDPDRLRTPMRRDASGAFHPIGWDEAFEITATRLNDIRRRHGADSIAVYIGNPAVHNHGLLLLRNGFLKAVGTKNCFSAGSQDTSPRFAASYHLYGNSLVVPVPDVDRTGYFLCIGANPAVSNGSFLGAPNMRGRLRAIRERGGKVVVVDPRLSETARDADEHVPIRPGGDAALLLSMVQVLHARGRLDRDALARLARGWERVEAHLAAFAPARVEPVTGVPAATVERLALEFAEAKAAVAYSRIGVCNNAHGTLATYATDLLNLCAGRLGEIGGAMFSTPAIDLAALAPFLGDGHDRWRSRVRGLPETLGDLPAAAMAEEMETPGEGQIRALINIAGNPVLSVPNGRRLDRALGGLEFVVGLDLYVNETTRHADILFPSAWAMTEDHVTLLVANHFVRNVARWSPAATALPAGERHDWEIALELAERLGGGPTGWRGLDRLYRIAKRFGYRWTPASSVDLALRLGPWGDRFLPFSKGLNLRKVKAAPHGIDLGPLQPGVQKKITHADHRVHLDAPPFVDALASLAAEVGNGAGNGRALLLIGRREVRTNNSWMHNVPALVAGRDRCVLLVHPADAERAGVRDGDAAVLQSRVHSGTVNVRVSDEMSPGVVSLPHGWGHTGSAPWQTVATQRPGVSANDWTDDERVESIVGQSVLNGVPVDLRPAVLH